MHLFNKVKNKIIAIASKCKLLYMQCHRRGFHHELTGLLLDQAPGSARSQNNVLVELFWDNPHHYLRVALFLHALKSYKVNFVIERSAPWYVVWTLKKFCPSNIFFLDTQIKKKYLEKAEELLKGVSNAADFMAMKLEDSYPPHIVHDDILKRQALATVDFNLPEVKTRLALSLQRLTEFRELFERHHFSHTVTSHPTTVNCSTMAWQALLHKSRVYVLNYAHEHITIKKIRTEKDFSMPVDSAHGRDFLSMADNELERLAILGEEHHKNVRENKAGQFTVVDLYKQKRINITRESFAKLIGAKPENKNVIIFTNCWSDFPNNEGRFQYTDYFEWFLHTADQFPKRLDVNFIIRPHPAEHHYGDKSPVKKIFKLNGKNVFWWPTELGPNNILDIADLVVTSRGSSGVEYSALGMRVLVAAHARYTDIGFVTFCTSKEDYAQKLLHFEDIPFPDEKKMKLANATLAIAYTTPETLREGGYVWDFGFHSYNLWLSMPAFIRKFRPKLLLEASILKLWLESEHDRYNVFKHLHESEWNRGKSL